MDEQGCAEHGRGGRAPSSRVELAADMAQDAPDFDFAHRGRIARRGSHDLPGRIDSPSATDALDGIACGVTGSDVRRTRLVEAR